MQIAICADTKAAIELLPAFANRHGLIAGATGTGKTISLQVLAEQFSSLGVPIFMSDVKGDLAGMSQTGVLSAKMEARLKELNLPQPNWGSSPVVFWDVHGKLGHPIRTTISEMGPILLARLLALNDVQASVLQILFKIADDHGWLLIDLKDLTALIREVQDGSDKYRGAYGNLSPASLGTIQRSLLTLEEKGAKAFFGEPSLNILDFVQTDQSGKGVVNILAADKLLQSPTVYSTFLLWMLSELFEVLPEVGDLDKPKLVFFFDEAHLLFRDAPKALVETIEQVVRLVRSKGVGIYFVTQSPSDIPERILSQLSHRVQHALRAFTPADQKSVRTAAETLRPNPKFKAEEAITQLAVGEALISVLDSTGAPTIVERASVLPPRSRIGPISESERAQVVQNSAIGNFYDLALDRESAFEMLAKKSKAPSQDDGETSRSNRSTARNEASVKEAFSEALLGSTGPRGGRRPGVLEKAATSAARSVASSIGREIVRGLLGSMLGRRR